MIKYMYMYIYVYMYGKITVKIIKLMAELLCGCFIFRVVVLCLQLLLSMTLEQKRAVVLF